MKHHVFCALSPALVEEVELGAALDALAEVVELRRWPGPGNPTPRALNEALEWAEVLITGWGTPPLEGLQDWSPERSPLRLIVHSAGSVKFLVPREVLEHGLFVAHANESLAEAVAEFTLGLIVLGRRQVFTAARRMHEDRPRLPVAAQWELRGSTVGIIGASAIGKRVLEYLRPLGAHVLLADPFCTPEIAAAYDAELVELPELLQRSDTVSLHAPVTDATLGMIGKREFGQMKDGALFINTARGRLIDADALLAELQTGRLNAILDVTDPTEPLPNDSPFFQLDSCVVLPHMAGISVQARQRQGQMTIDEVLRYVRGEPLQLLVDAQRWDRMA